MDEKLFKFTPETQVPVKPEQVPQPAQKDPYRKPAYGYDREAEPFYESMRLYDPANIPPSQHEQFATAIKENPLDFDDMFKNFPNKQTEANKFETAKALQFAYGMSEEQAMNFANIGIQAGGVDQKTHQAGNVETLITTAKNTYHHYAGSMAMAMRIIEQDDAWQTTAEEQFSKIQPLWEKKNWAVETTAMGIQPLSTAGRYMGITLAVQGLPTAIAGMIGGVGAAKATSMVTKPLAIGLNFLITGLSQIGGEYYELSQMRDDEGNKIDLDSPIARKQFLFGAALKGSIETLLTEALPGVRMLRGAISPAGLDHAIFDFTWKSMATKVLFPAIGVTIGEAFIEEPADQIDSGLRERFLKEIENEQGANFDLPYYSQIVDEALSVIVPTAQSMIPTVLVTSLFGGGAYSVRMHSDAKKSFNQEKGTVAIDLRAIKITKRDILAEVQKVESQKASKKESDAPAGPKPKMDAAEVVMVGTNLIPVTPEDASKVLSAIDQGRKAGQFKIVNMPSLAEGEQETVLNQAALSTDGNILNENTIVYDSEEDRQFATMLLSQNIESSTVNGDSVDVIIRNENGDLTTLSLKVVEEGMELTSPDASQYTDPEAPYSLARTTADQALVWQEKNIIRKAIGDAVAHTKGRISSQALEASVDAMKIVSDTIGVPVDELLKDGLVFKLVQSEDGERGWTEDNITVDGKKQYTIGITERGDAKTIIHEIGHFLRGTATKEQLAEFTQHYGQGKEGVWIEDINQVGDKFFIGDTEYATRDEAFAEIEVNEERFAEDFVTYFATGIAPTEGLAKVFERMKNVLKAMMEQYKWEIDPEVKAAFDSLFTGEVQGSLDTNLEVGGGENILFDRTSSKEIDKQYFEALERGDTEAAQKIIDAQAVAKGYISDMEYRMQHKAPNGSDDFSANLAKIEETDLIPKDYWTHPQYYLSDGERTSFYRVKNALERYKENGKANLKLYRAVDKNIKEEKFRNGDWVTPDSEYARDHGSGIPGGYKIISQSVPLEHIYWDVNSIAELGYDDGEVYAYKDTKNNRKLTDVITRDFDGEIIPPSKRFNYREYYKFFDRAPQVGSEAFNDLFENTEVIDENGKPMMVYHGSPNAGIDSFNTDLIYASNSEETATDFSYEQLPGSSNFTFVPGDQGEVYPMYMNIENPLDFRNLSQEDFTNIKDAIQKYNPEAGIQLDLLKNAIGKNPAHQHMKFVAEDLVNHLKEYGYDGLIAEMTPGGSLEFAAISPDQVRQAEGRNKLFDRSPEYETAVKQASYETGFDLAMSKVWKNNRDFKLAMQEKMLKAAEATGIDITKDSAETRAFLRDVGIENVRYALAQNPNAVGWYDIKTRQALAIMSLIHPEIATDEVGRFAFIWATAVASNGLKVGKNFELAEKAYEIYQKTGRMPANIGIGTARKAINEGMELFNTLVDTWGIDDLMQFMVSDFTVGELSKINAKLKPGGEHVDVSVKGSAILGPKVGNGFFSNLYGYFQSLTMDRWLVRTWGRWTGTLIDPKPTQTANAQSRLQKNITSILKNKAETARLSKAIGFDINKDSSINDIAEAVQKASMVPATRNVMNKTNRGTELRLAGNSLAGYLDGQKEAPGSPHERKQIRHVFNSILSELKLTDELEELTMADMQAVLWYAEKRLYETASSKAEIASEDSADGYTDEEAPDYANASKAVALAKGISESTIDAVIKETENERAARTQLEIKRSNGGEQEGEPSIYDSKTDGRAQSFTEKEKRKFITERAIIRARSNSQSNEESSGTYSTGSDRDGGVVRVLKPIGISYNHVWEISGAVRNIFRSNDIATPKIYELEQTIENAQQFHDFITNSKENLPYGSSVYVYPVEEYQDMRLFVTEDGKAGVAIKDDGDIISVFSTNKSGHALLELAVSAGGFKLDAFDTILPSFYAAHGFEAVSRLTWDDSQAPDEWNKETYNKFNNGEPDVVFMVYNPSKMDADYSLTDGERMEGDDAYDKATTLQIQEVDRIAAMGPRKGGNILYLLSEEAKGELLESRKEEVKTAVENFYYIPTEILAEYIVEEWADSELMFRAYIDNTPWLLEEARNYENTDEFIEHVKSQTDDPDYKWVDQDDSWFKRIHAYARIMDPAEKDAQFVRIHIGTDKNLVEFGKKLRRYQDVGANDTVVSRWGAFRGVSTKVKTLTDSSTAEQLAEARSLIQKNPRPYRRAMQVIDQAADRVSGVQGELQVGEASRDAFYDALGEEMLDALNEPLLLNQMTTKEAAAYLRTTTDKAEQYSAREKLATHEGVLAMERQANAELKRLGAEKDSDIKSLEKQLSKANAEVSNLQEKVAVGKEVSKDLTVKKNEVKRLTRLLATKVKQVDAMKLRKEIEKFHKKLLATVEYNPDTIDVSFEEAFNALHELFKLNQKAGEMKALPEVMNQYLPENMVPMVQEGRSIAKWNLGELQVIYEAAKLMREDARYILNQKKAHRANKLQNLATQMYRQQYGEMPDIGAGYGSVVNDIIDDLTLNRKGYDENIFDAVFQTVKASIGKMQRISRMIDGNQEGIMYDLLVREAYNRMTEELRESYRRLTEADAKMKSLEITANTLVKDAFTHTTRSGEKKTLSKAEVIGLYVYSQNPIGLAKLTHNRGNNIAPYDLDRAIGSLSVNERAWGDYMIDNLGGDEVWTRMDETYRDVYNMSLGRRERYFTFVAEGSLNEGKTDLLAGPEGKSIRYVDKGFTKIINPNAIYPLKLNTNHTFVSQVKRQEHFIQWADWVRDMNYLMERGAIGRIVEMNHGPKYTRVIQEYINNVGSPQIILDDIERLGSKLVSNAGVAALSLNALVSLKQAGSYAAVVRGDIGAVELAHATLRMSTPSGFKEATEFIYEMSPYMLKRSISVEIDRYNASDFDTKLGRGVQSFNEKIGMKGISMIDHAVVSPMWLAAYDTYINRNVDNLEGEALTKEAAFRATQMISETQPSSIPTDLASIQMKKSPWVRSALLFSNQIFQYLNMTWYDIPGSLSAYHANHDKKFLKAAVGSTVSLALSGAMIILASGAAFRKKDEPDEKYWKRMRTEIAKTTAVYFIPIVGSAVSEGMTGFSGSDIVDLPAKLGRFMATDWTKKERISKNLWDLAGALGSTQALPVAFTKRLVKFSNKGNPFEMLGANYADLWEKWVE